MNIMLVSKSATSSLKYINVANLSESFEMKGAMDKILQWLGARPVQAEWNLLGILKDESRRSELTTIRKWSIQEERVGPFKKAQKAELGKTEEIYLDWSTSFLNLF